MKAHEDVHGLLEKLALGVVPILVDAAKEALEYPDTGGLDFAVCLLKDAQRYDSLYPHAKGGISGLISGTQILQQPKGR